MTKPTKTAERFHLSRAALWPLMVPVFYFTDLKTSVFAVILLSLYANFAGDISAWQAAKAGRRSLEANDEGAPSGRPSADRSKTLDG